MKYILVKSTNFDANEGYEEEISRLVNEDGFELFGNPLATTYDVNHLLGDYQGVEYAQALIKKE